MTQNLLASGVTKAVQEYARFYRKKVSDLCILWVIENGGCSNFAGQGKLQYKIEDNLSKPFWIHCYF